MTPKPEGAELPPLPCPFCGSSKIDTEQGSTYRWMRAVCRNCEAACGEVRAHVTGSGANTRAIADGQRDALAAWNERAVPESQFQGGLDNDELREAWDRKVPGVAPTDRELTAFALGVEVGDAGKRVYFVERNSARDAWRRRVKQCEELEATLAKVTAQRDALREAAEEALHFIELLPTDIGRGSLNGWRVQVPYKLRAALKETPNA